MKTRCNNNKILNKKKNDKPIQHIKDYMHKIYSDEYIIYLGIRPPIRSHYKIRKYTKIIRHYILRVN